jgi:HK97 family phage prohead protease
MILRSADSELAVVRFAPDIEVQRGGDGRTVHGILVPWDTPAQVFDHLGPSGRPAPYQEAVARGAFPEAVANPQAVKLLGHHNKQVNPLGRGSLIRDDAAGLYGEFRVSKTQAGDEALELVRDLALDAFSVGFVPIESVERGDVYVRTRGRLNETSLVTFGAYAGALVGGVRTQELPPEGQDPGVGEPPAEGGSGDLQTERTGMTTQERSRAIALMNLPRS